MKRDKTEVKVEKQINDNNNNITHVNNNSKNESTNDTKSLIKKTQSVSKNNSYLKFNNDNILINKINNSNADSASSLKQKKRISKNKNKNYKEIINESIQNSVLSDLSDYYLNRKSIDMKNNVKEDDSSKNINKNSYIFSTNKKPSLILNQNIANLINLKKNSKEFSEISSKESSIEKTLKPNKIKNLKKSIIFKNHLKIEETIITDNKNKNNRNSEKLKLDKNLKTLKEQLKKTLILTSEEDLDYNYGKKKEKIKKN